MQYQKTLLLRAAGRVNPNSGPRHSRSLPSTWCKVEDCRRREASMVSEVLPRLFRIEVPLPGNPLKAVNSWVITSARRNLVIDTGMDRTECSQALQAGLAELDIDLGVTDFFITHLHADHVGLVAAFATPTSVVYFSQTEAEFLDSISEPRVFLDMLIERARKIGFPESEIEASVRRHPGFQFSPPAYPPFTFVRDGDQVEAGDYRFRCLETPGHTTGHLCLYEPHQKLLVSGDHVLGDITPNITLWSEESDPLEDYLASLDRVSALDVELVLPGHRRVFTDCRGRIEELKRHHQARLEEILAILGNGARTVYEVASEMTWDIEVPSWEAFPPMPKWFAAGEAASHLWYLEGKGRLRREERNGVFVFSLK